MKKSILLLLLFSLSFIRCDSNPNYESNLAKAKKTFELFQNEDIETQMSLFSDELVYTPPTYGAKDMSKDEFKSLLQMYHAAFDDIVYSPEVWLPGTDDKGKLDGSVRSYGTWNSKDAKTGKETTPLRSYHFFNFNAEGEIIAQGDFFDATGLLTSIGLTNTLINHKNEIINVVNMSTNVSDNEVEAFSEKYQSVVNNLETSSLSFRFARSGKNKVTLIERYINSEALLLHIKNISPGGKISKDFEEFQKVFSINNMTLYGNVSDDLKKAIKPFNIKTKYVPVIAGYSR
jgi:hypothetical protein